MHLRIRAFGSVLSGLLLAGVAAAAAADEIDRLAAATHAPARFAAHQPAFRVEERTVDQLGEKGRTPLTLWLVHDGERCVAVYHPGLYQLDVVSFQPDQAPTNLVVPLSYSWARLFGVRVTTCLWYDGMGSSGDTNAFRFTGGGDTLALTVEEHWTRKRQADALRTLTFRCDPVLGYVVDIHTRLSTTDSGRRPDAPQSPPAQIEFINAQPADLTSPWPGRWRHDRTVWTPAGGTAIRGLYNNLVALDRGDNAKWVIRDGGYVGWVQDGRTWGLALVHRDFGGAHAENATCNMWGDQHHLVRLPDKPGADGRYTLDLAWRLVGLPPEVSGAIVEQAVMETFGGAREVQVRLGVNEDFEDQPLPLTSIARGCWSWGTQVTEARARGGKKALLVKAIARDKIGGDSFRFIAPFIPLDPNACYHLEAWAWVEGADTVAYISDGFPKDQPSRIGHRQTNRAVGGQAEWQKIALDVTTGEGGGSFDLRFVAAGSGTAYFDDFSFRRVR